MYINWVYASSPQTPAIRNKSKDWLAQIQDDVSEWSNLFLPHQVHPSCYSSHHLRACFECGRSRVRVWSDQTKNYEIGTGCFSAMHAALRRKSEDWMTRNQYNVSKWSEIVLAMIQLKIGHSLKLTDSLSPYKYTHTRHHLIKYLIRRM